MHGVAAAVVAVAMTKGGGGEVAAAAAAAAAVVGAMVVAVVNAKRARTAAKVARLRRLYAGLRVRVCHPVRNCSRQHKRNCKLFDDKAMNLSFTKKKRQKET